MNTIRVVAAVVDTKQLTLYTEDGGRMTIPQGDARLAQIVKEITPVLARGFGSVATVQLDAVENTYTQFEQQSGGLVKFFRVAKSRLTKLFAKPEPEQVLPMSLGVPVYEMGAPKSMFVESPNPNLSSYANLTPMVSEKILSDVEEVMAHAKPVSNESPMGEDETIVAQVGDQIITGVERLKPQMARAVALGSSKGMDAFFKRVAAVAAERRHSTEDLLRFMERGDLPVADDGSIVIYKVLRRRHDDKGLLDGYVDCHTSRVTQRVGSYVCMSPEMVDHDRRNECSNGLHVARRAYISGFSGDVCVLAKVAPEDVIAVPDYDANKMRVCGYHILFELSDEAYSKLRANRPFTDGEEGQFLLGRALVGDHPDPIERVEITEQHGGGVKITSLVKHKTPASIIQKVAEAVAKAEALPDETDGGSAPAVDPKAVSASVVAAKAKTRAEKAHELYVAFLNTKMTDRKAAAQAIMDFKKASKLGWGALGLSQENAELVQRYLND